MTSLRRAIRRWSDCDQVAGQRCMRWLTAIHPASLTFVPQGKKLQLTVWPGDSP
ncbi:hypothetical protein [Rosistilla oblonga]|uniref:hypothetical protein n=1 Tax=Rosistilla oblonga TaxID=2527990 RepID=UPI001E5E7865|nr:hypothetical protein [Rosistilla oblonga]